KGVAPIPPPIEGPGQIDQQSPDDKITHDNSLEKQRTLIKQSTADQENMHLMRWQRSNEGQGSAQTRFRDLHCAQTPNRY
ncbi:MAG: hypothetical protein ACKO3C_01505, partial [Betaproteobacteria bacterium]